MTSQPKHRPPDPRRLAASVLKKVSAGHQTLDAVLEEASEAGALTRKDRALFQTLVFGVLRHRTRLDAYIARFSNTPLHRIDPPVLTVIRLAAFQLTMTDRIPPFAAVDTAVKLTGALGLPRATGFVNGVLRRLAADYKEVPFPDSGTDPLAHLIVAESLPEWLADRWLKRFGPRRAKQLATAVNEIPPVTLRINPLRTDRSALLSALKDAADTRRPAPLSPWAVQLTGLKKPIPAYAPYSAGLFQVQDEAAQLVSFFAAPQPGSRFLDACAGLGGKTGHLAGLMENTGVLVAADHDREKQRRLIDEMRRLGIEIVTPRLHDLSQSIKNASHDGVLLDAPCSGLGVLRRNPDAKWTTGPGDLPKNRKRQTAFLSNLANSTAPGGMLTYAVCSFEPEETDQVTSAFLAKHPEFTLDQTGGGLPEPAREALDETGALRTFPHIHGTDGFYAVRFAKRK